MREHTDRKFDWVAALAFGAGAAVMIASMIALAVASMTVLALFLRPQQRGQLRRMCGTRQRPLQPACGMCGRLSLECLCHLLKWTEKHRTRMRFMNHAGSLSHASTPGAAARPSTGGRKSNQAKKTQF